jgi:predicted HAD superfamily phosphohydrolase YqeG
MDLIKYLGFIKNGLILHKRIITDQAKSVFTIDFNKLKKDCDLSDQTKTLLKALHAQGFKIAVFSNCTGKRNMELENMLGAIGIYNITRSDKPSPKGFLEAMDYYKITPEKTVAIGDKVGTEMYGAYLACIKHRILVEPFSTVVGERKPPFIYSIHRDFEKVIFFRCSQTCRTRL